MKILLYYVWTVLLSVAMTACTSCSRDSSPAGEETLRVTATAYNSVENQTDDTPTTAAWGDELKPGMKVIAVSRDLVDMGLTRGVKVRIKGMEGEYIVLDRMASRWRRKIDIYMGEDVQAAKEWGNREVQISWTAAGESE